MVQGRLCYRQRASRDEAYRLGNSRVTVGIPWRGVRVLSSCRAKSKVAVGSILVVFAGAVQTEVSNNRHQDLVWKGDEIGRHNIRRYGGFSERMLIITIVLKECVGNTRVPRYLWVAQVAMGDTVGLVFIGPVPWPLASATG